jgi:hypothetical protein
MGKGEMKPLLVIRGRLYWGQKKLLAQTKLGVENRQIQKY